MRPRGPRKLQGVDTIARISYCMALWLPGQHIPQAFSDEMLKTGDWSLYPYNHQVAHCKGLAFVCDVQRTSVVHDICNEPCQLP